MAMSKQAKQDMTDAALKALGHPLRRAVLKRLDSDANGGLSPSELAGELGTPLPNLSYHVRTLVETGVIKLVKTRPRRGAIEHYYKRTGNAVDKKVAELLDNLGSD